MPYRTRAAPPRALPLLARYTVRAPCEEPWEEMVGDARARTCARCRKTVFDLTAMSGAEVEDFLSSHVSSNEAACVRIHMRPDGRLLSSACDVARERAHARRVASVSAIAAGAAALLGVASTPTLSPDPSWVSPEDREMTVPSRPEDVAFATLGELVEREAEEVSPPPKKGR